MEHIRSKIEKLLRLAMSDNPHEAALAAERATELMQKYAISTDELNGNGIVTKSFDLDYARIPVWIRELYSGLSSINGCYMVWRDGHRDSRGKALRKQAQITLTGRESDVDNTEFYLHVFIREIEKRSKAYSMQLGNIARKREKLKAYRIGLGQGLVQRISEAMQRYEEKTDALANAPVSVDSRYEAAREHYLSSNEVRTVSTKIDKSEPEYFAGLIEAEKVTLNRPVKNEAGESMLLENH